MKRTKPIISPIFAPSGKEFQNFINPASSTGSKKRKLKRKSQVWLHFIEMNQFSILTFSNILCRYCKLSSFQRNRRLERVQNSLISKPLSLQYHCNIFTSFAMTSQLLEISSQARDLSSSICQFDDIIKIKMFSNLSRNNLC